MALIFLCVCQCVPSQVWWRRRSCALGWTGAPRPISPPLGPPICPWTPCTRSSFASLPSCSAACAVCRTWRSFLSDPEFAAAHRRLEPPLIIAGYNDRSFEISLANIMDLSGGIVKQAPGWPQCRGHARPQPRLRHEHRRRQLQICRPGHCSCVLRMGRGRTHPVRHCGQVSGRAGCEHGGVQGATEGYAFSCRRIWVPV
jgi:hypothetical protein